MRPEVGLWRLARHGICLAGSAAVVASAAAAAEAPDPVERRARTYQHLMQAQLAAREGRFLRALREVREAAALDPDSAELHAEGARLLLDVGQVLEAERLARRALEIEPDQTGALRVLGDLMAGRAFRSPEDSDSRREAIGLYRRLVADGAVDDPLLHVLAQLELANAEPDAAAATARRLVARRPGEPGALRLLVQALVTGGRREEALEALLDYVVHHAEDEQALPMVEELADQTGRWDRLTAVLEPAVSQPRAAAGLQWLYAKALLEQNRTVEAVPLLERAAARRPDHLALRTRLAQAYWLVGRLADASALASEIAEQDPGRVQAYWVLAEVHAARREYLRAAEAYAKAVELLAGLPGASPEQRDVLRRRWALARLESGDAAGALEVLGEIEVREPDAETAGLFARAAVAAGRRGEAEARARQWRASGYTGASQLLEAELAIADGAWPRAAVAYRQALESLGPPVRAWAIDRLLDTDAGRGLALEFAREQATSAPEDVQALYVLGGVLDRLGQHAEAEATLRRVLELDPGHAGALNNLGYSLADRNERLEEALDLIQRALAREPWNGAFLDSLGWVLFRLGRYEEALEPLERAAREYPHDPIVLEHLGDLYERLRRIDAAREAWRRALEAGAEDRESLQRKIDRLPPEAARHAAQAAAPEIESPR